MTKFTSLLLVLFSLNVYAQDFDRLTLAELASGLNQPIGMISAGDGSDRLFIIEQDGIVKIYNGGDGSVNSTPFLNITSRVDSQSNEQGLLGLAFHPDYANNGYFYVNYIRDPGPGQGQGQDKTIIARFSVSEKNRGIADSGSESKLMEIPQDSSNHNGGDLHFGPDGFLYIAMGDGGGSDDQFGHAQDINSLKGKMLRIDVDAGPAMQDVLCGEIQNYGVPDDNPFVGRNGCDEIWSYGLRNPWRFSFDRNTGDMLIGDVGQRSWEEIDFEPAGTGGLNYGWSCREGAHDFSGGRSCVSAHVDPVLEYDHDSGCSVTGGYVYRGSVGAFNGYYFYGDYCSHQIWLAHNPGSGWVSSEWTAAAAVLASISSFGEADNGDLYVADRNAGKVFRIQVADDEVFADSFENLPGKTLLQKKGAPR
jgi:glucose/arabinose dehydrogenase